MKRFSLAILALVVEGAISCASRAAVSAFLNLNRQRSDFFSGKCHQSMPSASSQWA